LKKRAWLTLLLIGSGETAIAQSYSARPPVVGSAGRAGAPARHIDIGASVDVNYDSNVFGLSDTLINQGRLNGREKDDYSISPSLRLDMFLPLGRQSVFAGGSIGYNFYANNKQRNREHIGLKLGGNAQLTNTCSVGTHANYSRSLSDAGDVFVLDEGELIRRGNTREFRSIGAQAQCAGLVGISPSFGYNHAETRNSLEFFKLNDSNQDSFDLSIGYQRPALGRVSIYGTYSKGEYLHRNILGLPDVIPGVPHDGVKSYSAGARFERSIGSRISGSASLGYSWVNPEAIFARKFRGATYALSLNVIPTTRMSVDLIAERSSNLSNSVLASLVVNQIYAINGTYKLNDQMNLNFGTSFQRRNYHQDGRTIDQVEVVSKDKFTRTYGGFAYNLNRRIRLNGLVSHQRRSADNPLFRYSNTSATLGVSLSLSR
jgi:hypothetical protein